MRRKNNGLLMSCRILVLPLIIILLLFEPVYAERVYFAGYNGGFYIKSEEEGGMELRLGGSFQADYRAYAEDERADNRFDIRRARLIFRGQLTQWFRYGLEYEFQGNETNNLVDAYGEWLISGIDSLRFGQYKEPFSLEWQAQDKSLLFAERSMGNYLTPTRDIGLMYQGSRHQGDFRCAVGLFNGDGNDGSTRGSENDEPEIAGRVVIKPVALVGIDGGKNFQIGASASYANKIDTANVYLKVKSSGMAGLERNLYVLTHDTKFGVLQDVDSRIRLGAETAFVRGPFVLAGEYISLSYTDLEPVTGPAKDAEFSSWYVSAAWCVTGEQFSLAKGVLEPIYPLKFFNPDEKTYGALCLAARYDHFSGDKDWIQKTAYVSAEEADALSLCATWILFPMYRIQLDYTRTEFSDLIRARVNPDGSIDYIDKENVLTARFSMDF